MIKQPLIPAILAFVLLSAPLAALAQSTPTPQSDNGRWQHDSQMQQPNTPRENGRDGNHRTERDDANRQYPGNSQYGRSHNRGDNDNDGQRGNDGRQNGNYGNQNGNQLNGTVASFSAFNLQLNNGQQVVLHQGTIINPTGTTLQPGMRVSISGYSTGNGQFAANQINVIGNGYSNNGNGVNGVGGNILTNILGSFGLGSFGL